MVAVTGSAPVLATTTHSSRSSEVAPYGRSHRSATDGEPSADVQPSLPDGGRASMLRSATTGTPLSERIVDWWPTPAGTRPSSAASTVTWPPGGIVRSTGSERSPASGVISMLASASASVGL